MSQKTPLFGFICRQVADCNFSLFSPPCLFLRISRNNQTTASAETEITKYLSIVFSQPVMFVFDYIKSTIIRNGQRKGLMEKVCIENLVVFGTRRILILTNATCKFLTRIIPAKFNGGPKLMFPNLNQMFTICYFERCIS